MDFTEDREVLPLARMAMFACFLPSTTTVQAAYSSFSQLSMKLSQSSITMSILWT